MGQNRLNSVALISIERCYVTKLIENDIDSVIDTFAKRKHRHRYFFYRTEMACSLNIWNFACLCSSHISGVQRSGDARGDCLVGCPLPSSSIE